jgi:hypothetical protein
MYFHALAHGTVTVLTGIVMDKRGVAGFAFTYVGTHFRGPAFSNAANDIQLFVGK